MSFKGIDVRESGDKLLFRAFLQDGDGAKVTTGTTSLYLYELQADGTLKSYDFNDNTFKTTALTTETLALTHRTGNNATTNTGIWTEVLSTLTGFTAGNIYFVQVNNSNASSPWRTREFQYGNAQGDLDSDDIHLAKAALVNKREHTIDTGVDVIKDDDGATTLKTLTPSESNGVVTVTPS